MTGTGLNHGGMELLEDIFDEVVTVWGLSTTERDAVRGVAVEAGLHRRGNWSGFVVERMALVVDIDRLLRSRMDGREVRLWVRRRVPGILSSSPLDQMVGSTDRLRGIRAMLLVEAVA